MDFKNKTITIKHDDDGTYIAWPAQKNRQKILIRLQADGAYVN
jgi:hypothetical protein